MRVRDVLTRARFRAWLEAQPAGSVVGLSGATAGCPIHAYLHTVFPTKVIGVYGAYYMVDGKQYIADHWVNRVVHAIDGRRRVETVTREKALAALEAAS